ncbi:Retinol dehydrogenase 11 [Pseudocercospora fuligena]|uniref:Retinol dehydrogenase 11 n=1 Tax=Pseudocercospora fuligena TaxID=685502 RepID=A0A8H6RFB8_9PEZI|nr:Retinol dehydrogenase 11 [Pseudocercospora fuligena]
MASIKHSFNPATDIPPLNNKVILITGANTGLGKQTALELAQHSPAQIWLTSRDFTKGQTAVEEVQKIASPGTKIHLLQLDLSSFASIKSAAKTFLSSVSRLDILFLNAGVLGHPPALTDEGYEIHMGTNHLGHALLLKLLTPLLNKTSQETPGGPSRVVSLTSIGYRLSDSSIHFHKLRQPDGLPQILRYIQSKLANLLYAKEVAKRYRESKIVSVHPGEVDTELFSREPGDEQVRFLVEEVAPKRVGSLEEGVKNQIWAAVAEVESGAYYEPVGRRAEEGLANDVVMARMLWEWT